MIRKRVTQMLWGYGGGWTARVMQGTSTQAGRLRGACPLEEIAGETVDTTEHLDFGFSDHLSFKQLGVSHRAGGLMSYWVITIKGTAISHTTVQIIANLKKETADEVKAAVNEFNSEISGCLKEEEDLAYDGAKLYPEDWSEYR
jgi:hypothetical protein